MHNIRVFQLARDLGLSSQDVIDRLKRLGVEARTASSSIDEDTADKLKRALKIDQLTATKRRVYGSEEDESEREAQERQMQERIAAERAAREHAAEEARQAAEARKKGKGKGKAAEAEAEKKVEEPAAEAPAADDAEAPAADDAE